MRTVNLYSSVYSMLNTENFRLNYNSVIIEISVFLKKGKIELESFELLLNSAYAFDMYNFPRYQIKFPILNLFY